MDILKLANIDSFINDEIKNLLNNKNINIKLEIAFRVEDENRTKYLQIPLEQIEPLCKSPDSLSDDEKSKLEKLKNRIIKTIEDSNYRTVIDFNNFEF